ncbi:30S ribosomal protein S2 [Candidatus Micrarchaeota archaeon]|nr:MAG: 30S ribosomal protein S2 [Candidatus Micrarchaeota archaeon]
MTDTLLPQEKYLESGIHIGTKMKTPDMKKYIYKERQDKLFVLDLKQVDERIKLAANLIAQYDPAKIYVIASRTYAGIAASAFSGIIGCNLIKGRFIPGSMTNPARPNFFEPSLILVCDPKNEWQAIREASATGTPVIGLCDTDNSTRFLDLVVPCNNKGKKALALIFFLLAREVMKSKGLIAADSEFGHTLDEFDVPLEALESSDSKPEPKKEEEKEPEEKPSAKKKEEKPAEKEKTEEQEKKPEKPAKKKHSKKSSKPKSTEKGEEKKEKTPEGEPKKEAEKKGTDQG